ncbi:unnamed protein product, partial [Aphanomyces euteiches]
SGIPLREMRQFIRRVSATGLHLCLGTYDIELFPARHPRQEMLHDALVAVLSQFVKDREIFLLISASGFFSHCRIILQDEELTTFYDGEDEHGWYELQPMSKIYSLRQLK